VFGFGFEAEKARGFSVVVSNGGLFEPFIEFEELIISRFRLKVLDIGCGLFKLLLGHMLM